MTSKKSFGRILQLLPLISLPIASPLIFDDVTLKRPEGVSQAFKSQGIASGGLVGVSFNVTGLGTSPLYVFLISEEQRIFYEEQSERLSGPAICAPPSSLMYQSLNRGMVDVEFRIRETDKYTLYFGFCGGSKGLVVTGSTWYINRDSNGHLEQHLPIEQAMLPTVMRSVAIGYATLLTVWILRCCSYSKNVQPLHITIAVWITLSLGRVWASSVHFSILGSSGRLDRDWWLAREWLDGFSQWLFMGILLALAAPPGTWFSKIRICLCFSYLTHFCAVSLNMTCKTRYGIDNESSCQETLMIEWIIQNCLQLIVLLLINHRIQSRRFDLQQRLAPITPAMAMEYISLRAYSCLRSSFLLLLLLPTIMLIIDEVVLLSWHHYWVTLAVNEFLFIAIWLPSGLSFFPNDSSLLTQTFRQPADN